MKIFKKLLLLVIFFTVILGGAFFYAFKIEPYRIRINEYPLNEKQAGRKEFKIVQISDLHIKEDFTAQNLDKVVKKINELHPDIVLFTGDLYDHYAQYHDDENIIAELKKIEAKYDKIAIWGNRDYGGGAARQYKSILDQSGFTLLKNEHRTVTLDNGKQIAFTGLDDSMLGKPKLPDPKTIGHSDFQILLTHEPDAAEEYLQERHDIVFSGHSHGGQINIPFLPAINRRAVAMTSLSTKYSGGMYPLNGHQKLYVNTGIGTTHISARFGVVPEIALFRVYL